MRNDYQFSVLMSVYHKEKAEYLKKSLESIIEEQTLKPDEVVLVCDGPLTAELDAVIECFQQRYSFFEVYRLSENVGLGKALNFGLSKCTYDWVARMDSDDICHPRRFEEQIAYLKTHSEVEVLGAGIAEFAGEEDNIITIKHLPERMEDIYRFAKFRNPMSHVTVMFRKDVVLQHGSYLPLFYLEDYYLWVRLIAHNVVMANINQILVYVRVDNGMVNRRSDRRYVSGWFFLNNYMRKKGMISRLQLCRNMLAIVAFIYMPVWLKKLVYKFFLRADSQ